MNSIFLNPLALLPSFGSSVVLAVDAASLAAVEEFRAVAPDALARLGGQVWQAPSLLRPRDDVARRLKEAVAVAYARRAVHAAVSPDGQVWATSAGAASPAASPARDKLETLRRSLAEAQTLLASKTLAVSDFQYLLTLLMSIPTAAEIDSSKRQGKEWRNFFLHTAEALVGAAARGLEFGSNFAPLMEALVNRARTNIDALLQVPGEQEEVSPEDWAGMKHVELILAWQQLPWWVKWLTRKHCGLVREWKNPGAMELAVQLINDYHGRKDFSRLSSGLRALGIVSKQIPDLQVVRAIVLGKEYQLEREPPAADPEERPMSTNVWRHPDLPRHGVTLYARQVSISRARQ